MALTFFGAEQTAGPFSKADFMLNRIRQASQKGKLVEAAQLNKSLDASGGGVFRIIIGPAMR